MRKALPSCPPIADTLKGNKEAPVLVGGGPASGSATASRSRGLTVEIDPALGLSGDSHDVDGGEFFATQLAESRAAVVKSLGKAA
jgi:hypothetical protein